MRGRGRSLGGCHGVFLGMRRGFRVVFGRQGDGHGNHSCLSVLVLAGSTPFLPGVLLSLFEMGQ